MRLQFGLNVMDEDCPIHKWPMPGLSILISVYAACRDMGLSIESSLNLVHKFTHTMEHIVSKPPLELEDIVEDSQTTLEAFNRFIALKEGISDKDDGPTGVRLSGPMSAEAFMTLLENILKPNPEGD